MLRVVFPDMDTSVAFRFKTLMSELANRGVDLAKGRCFKSFNELRCLSNSLKHEGRVGNELAFFRRWRKGESLRDLKPHFDRLFPLMEKYLADLARRMERKIV